MSDYYAGNIVLFGATFTSVTTGVNTDPSTVTLEIGMPGVIPTLYTYGVSTITKLSTGIYQAAIDTTSFAPGDWSYQWRGIGTAQSINARTFTILAPPLS